MHDPRFGFLKQISATDYVREVTQASDNVWVVVHLFKDGVEDCLLLNKGLEEVLWMIIRTLGPAREKKELGQG